MTNRKILIITISILMLVLTSCGAVPDRAVTLEEILGETRVENAEQDGSRNEAQNEAQNGAQNGTQNGEYGAESGSVNPDESRANEALQASAIYVYVCGAVVSPGVVELPEGSRIRDALEAAGGFSEEACTEAINLAARLVDGEQLYFPTREEYGVSARDYVIFDSESVLVDAAGERININTASADELQKLPGIGESRARDIISFREGNGGFGKIEDIMKVSGIKESIFSKIYSLITV